MTWYRESCASQFPSASGLADWSVWSVRFPCGCPGKGFVARGCCGYEFAMCGRFFVRLAVVGKVIFVGVLSRAVHVPEKLPRDYRRVGVRRGMKEVDRSPQGAIADERLPLNTPCA